MAVCFLLEVSSSFSLELLLDGDFGIAPRERRDELLVSSVDPENSLDKLFVPVVVQSRK